VEEPQSEGHPTIILDQIEVQTTRVPRVYWKVW